jgi:limonene 1,2-monooxygenase
MWRPERMRFGFFSGPFSPCWGKPTLALDWDLELIQWLDYLGSDEPWIGERHSSGWEIVSSPKLFIAVAADRTRHIKRGCGRACRSDTLEPLHQPGPAGTPGTA